MKKLILVVIIALVAWLAMSLKLPSLPDFSFSLGPEVTMPEPQVEVEAEPLGNFDYSPSESASAPRVDYLPGAIDPSPRPDDPSVWSDIFGLLEKSRGLAVPTVPIPQPENEATNTPETGENTYDPR